MLSRIGLYATAAIALYCAHAMTGIASTISGKEKPKPLDPVVSDFVSKHGVEAVSFTASSQISGLELLALPDGAAQSRHASVQFDIPLSFEMTEQNFADDRSGSFRRIEEKYANLAERECSHLQMSIAQVCTASPISIKFKIVDNHKPVSSGFVSFDILLSYSERPRETNIASITRSRLVLESPELPRALGPKGEYRINPFEETLAKRKAYYEYAASTCAAQRKKFGNCAVLGLHIEQKPNPDFPLAYRHGVSAILGTLEDLGSNGS
jgi:hypothetical protein